MTPPRELPPTSAFAGDDGGCDPALAEALRALGAGTGSLAGVVAALAGTRVLVPVLAELEAAGVVEHGGHEHTVDKEASAGIVALQAPDGRTALPVFSSVASMQAWRPDARPVPTDVARAALSAVEERWELLVLDPGGPVTVLVPRPAVWALAQQRDWVPAVRRVPGRADALPGGAPTPGVGGADGGSEVDPDVRTALRDALAGVPEVLGVDARPGRRAEVAVLLRLVPGLDRARLDAVLARVNGALAADETVTLRVDSLELRLLAG
ncbi:SseB family protein [Cellulomonas cellasea]|uniref:SseB protein N-terminal domain-containing protein n=1 Tax=Cellulomonas cellasea TaxID=43670 RepID=A0A4Y3KWK3_9CELL|nr:SseB family protein [Cellulomonas cellasea]GEA88227.1 hypothetical protein CCE01nite_21760 [Cellulomonas cellasea]